MFESPLFAAALVGDMRAGGELIQSLGKDGLAGSSRGFPLLLQCAMMSGSWAMLSLLVDFAASLAGAPAAAACRRVVFAAAPKACRPFSLPPFTHGTCESKRSDRSGRTSACLPLRTCLNAHGGGEMRL